MVSLPATGEKTADIPTILQYYKAANVLAPPAAALEDSFRSGRTGVVSVGSQFRVQQDSEAYFQKFERPVLEAGLPIFRVRKTWFGRYVHDSGVSPSASLALGNSNSHKLLYWAKEHPAAAWISFLVTLIGLALGVWSFIK